MLEGLTGFLRISTTTPFNYAAARRYVSEVQFSSFVISLLYVVVIFSIKAAMSTQKPYVLKTSLRLWNLWLAVFSIAGSLVTTVALAQEWNKYGLVSKCASGGERGQGHFKNFEIFPQPRFKNHSTNHY